MNSRTAADIGHEIGEHNIRVFNLDIHNPVFIVSAALVVMLVIGTLLFLEQAATLFADLRVWTTTTFDWFYFAASNLFVLFCFGVALSPLGGFALADGAQSRNTAIPRGWPCCSRRAWASA